MQFKKNQIVGIPAWESNGPVYCVAFYLLNELGKENSQIDKALVQKKLLAHINASYGSRLTEEELLPFLQAQYRNYPMSALQLMTDAMLEQIPELQYARRWGEEKLLDSRAFETLGKEFHFNTRPHFNDSSAAVEDNGVQKPDSNQEINLNRDGFQEYNLNHAAWMNVYYLGAARSRHLQFNLICDQADMALANEFNNALANSAPYSTPAAERKEMFKNSIKHFQQNKESKSQISPSSPVSSAPAFSSSLSSDSFAASSSSSFRSPSPSPSVPASVSAPHSSSISMSLEPTERSAISSPPSPRKLLFTEPQEDKCFKSDYRYYPSEEKALGPDAASSAARTGPVCLATHTFPEKAHADDFKITDSTGNVSNVSLTKFNVLQSDKTARSLHTRLIFEEKVEEVLAKATDFNALGDKEKDILLAIVDKQIRDGRGSLPGSGRLVISINNNPASPMKPILQQAYKQYCMAMGITLKDLSQPEATRTVTSQRMTDMADHGPEQAEVLRRQIENYRNQLEDWKKEAHEVFEV